MAGPSQVVEETTERNICGLQGEVLWQQSENVALEQSRNVVLTAPSFGDAGRTTTDDPS